jgi:hypothetical protein
VTLRLSERRASFFFPPFFPLDFVFFNFFPPCTKKKRENSSSNPPPRLVFLPRSLLGELRSLPRRDRVPSSAPLLSFPLSPFP